jgi:mannose-1-phosphate guanylyltransferase
MNRPIDKEGGLWAIVLAAGEGNRLLRMTTVGGEAVPKQFCALRGEVSMLRHALQRAAWLAPEQHLRVVVAPQHRKWWQWELADLLHYCALEQPCDRGTAAGLLLPLTSILHRDPAATVVVLPADQFTEEEWVLRAALEAAAKMSRDQPERVLLLGMTPQPDRDPDHEWLIPRRRALSFGAAPVDGFRTGPNAVEAEALRSRGALLNSSIMVARGSTLRSLFEEHLPSLAVPFALWHDDERKLKNLYDWIPTYDLSRDLLQRSLDRLQVVAVPPCGWTDLATPERVVHCLASHSFHPGAMPTMLQPRRGFAAPVDLSRRLAAARGAA